MNLLFLTFGDNIKNHYQANFAILSFLKGKAGISNIYVFTDHPQYYAHYQEHVQAVAVTEAQLQEWKGPYDFFWRVKIKAIEEVMLKHTDTPLVYLDADTFLYGDITMLKDPLARGEALMHVQEGPLSQLKSKTEQKMWSQVKGLRVGETEIGAGHAMWNAGVVAIPAAQNTAAVALALHLCDTMCQRNVTRRLIEQFSLSVALAETYPMQPANAFIGHYWGNKEQWSEEISRFFLESHLKAYSVAQDIERIRHFDFKRFAMIRRIKKTRQRLTKAIDTLFPPKETLFLGGSEESR